MTIKSFILQAVVATVAFVILSPLILWTIATDRTDEQI